MEKTPEPDSFDSMEGVPRQDIPVAFDTGKKEGIRLKSEADARLARLDLGELSAWLEKYNSQFGWGGLLARVVIGTAHETDGKEQTLETSEQDQQLSFSEIQRRTRSLLEDSGLSLEPIRSGGVLMSSNLEGDDYPSQLRINLVDGKRFVHYLEVLHGSRISEHQRTGLSQVAENLTKQLKTEYELENPNDERLLELFGHASHIFDEYTRLEQEGAKGLGESTKELHRLFDIAKRGYLREELSAEKEDLLAEVGGQNFGPSKWHTDSSGDDYVKRWNRALDSARNMRSNPKALELFKKVQENLIASAEYVKEDITTKRTAEVKGRPWHRQQMTLLENVISTLLAMKAH